MQFFHMPLSIRNLFTVLFAPVLIFSFCLHSVQIHHTHFVVTHEHGEHSQSGESQSRGVNTPEVVMHVSDKKIFFILIMGLILVISFVTKRRIIFSLLLSAFRSAKIYYKIYGNSPRAHDYVSMYFRKGIYHSKAY